MGGKPPLPGAENRASIRFPTQTFPSEALMKEWGEGARAAPRLRLTRGKVVVQTRGLGAEDRPKDLAAEAINWETSPTNAGWRLGPGDGRDEEFAA